MSALNDTPWALTCPDPTPVMLKAEARLGEILFTLREGRLDGDLNTHGTERIRSAILAEAITRAGLDIEKDIEEGEGGAGANKSPHFDPDVLEATLALASSGLERLEQTRSGASAPATSVQVVLPPRRNDFPAATFFHPNPLMAFAIDRALDRAIASGRPLDDLTTSPVAVLVHLLASRSALCSNRLITHALVAVAECVRIQSDSSIHWFEISVPIGGATCKRRVLLDHATLAAIVPAARKLSTAVSSKRSTTVKNVRKLAQNDFKALLHTLPLDESGSRKRRHALDDYLRSVATLIHLRSCGLVAAHSAGMIASSSLQGPCHARLQGVATDVGFPGARTAEAAPSTAGQRPIVVGDSPADGDMVGEGLVAEIRRVVARTTKIDTEALELIRDGYPSSSTAYVVTDWVAHLVGDTRDGHGKQRHATTVNYYRGMMVSRLTHALPGTLAGISPEDLAECYRDLAETASSPAHRSRILTVLRMFQKFGVECHALPSVAELFPIGDSAGYDVSARIVLESEYRKALEALRVPTACATRAADHLMARCLLILCFRFGLRRAEALGLSIADVDHVDPGGVASIRDNGARRLKTVNARRCLPLALLCTDELEDLRLLAEHARTGEHLSLSSDTYLFFESPLPEGTVVNDHPAVGLAMDQLRRATGDRSLHLHHLRHSFATLQLLGALACDLDDAAQAQLPDWIRSAIAGAQRFQAACGAVVGSHGFRGTAVSHALGHGADATTYEHYVHALETIACSALAGVRHSGYEHSNRIEGRRSRNAEECLAAWLIGNSPESRPPDADWAAWIRRPLIKARIVLTVLAPVTDRRAASRRLDLTTALKLDGASTWRNAPSTAGAEEVAVAFFDRVAAIPLGHLRGCADTFRELRKRQTTRGWSSMKTQRAREIAMYLASIEPDTFAVDMRKKTYSNGKRSFEMLEGAALASWLEDGKGVTEVRIRQPMEVDTHDRSRHFRTIFWCLEAIYKWVDHAPEASTDPAAP